MPDDQPRTANQLPRQPLVTPVEEYESRRRIEIARVTLRIDNDVVAFGGAHFLTWMITCLGLGIVAEHGLESIALETVGKAILAAAGLGWSANLALAIDAAFQAVTNYAHLRWTMLLLAALPWAVLAFEAMIVLAGIAAAW